ncbi:MAG: hypothetical protein IJH79_09565 [Lentisphaeria bacterium]|nr:hypothetical protein [Lentisphaeria bacterium]
MNTVAGSIIDLTVKVRGIEDVRKLQRLKELSLEAELTVSGQEEAARLVAELSKKYGAFGFAVETTGAKIAAVNDTVAHMDRVRLAVDASDLACGEMPHLLFQIPSSDIIMLEKKRFF